ncbi:MAG: SMP-30/gluconolactonase/LRE family protein [Phycisphaeraceae bacterium]|nr:SMP-30/gluconolactonase/LRE family protein [Phycisphaeraceae bacterium]
METIKVADTTCDIGENPLWHGDEGVLYWVDIPVGRLHRYDPAAGKDSVVWQAPTGRMIGGFTIEVDGSLTLFMDRGTVCRLRGGKMIGTVIEQIDDETDTRFNDVIADPAGRVFAGMMPPDHRPGRLYRFDPDGSHRVVLEGLTCPNGMGFSADGTTFFFSDTLTRRIDAFDYDVATGEISGRRPFVQVPDREGEGGPDGMTIDADGRFWSARWGGSAVVAYNGAGREILRIEVPTVKKVSSVTFGGAGAEHMYLTTAGGRNRAEEGPDAGALFRVEGAGRGRPEFRSNLGGESE